MFRGIGCCALSALLQDPVRRFGDLHVLLSGVALCCIGRASGSRGVSAVTRVRLLFFFAATRLWNKENALPAVRPQCKGLMSANTHVPYPIPLTLLPTIPIVCLCAFSVGISDIRESDCSVVLLHPHVLLDVSSLHLLRVVFDTCARSAPAVCPQCARSVPAVCPQCARSAPAVRPQCARSAPAVCPQCARSVPAVRPQCARSVPAVCPQCARSAPAVRPQCARSVPAVRPQCARSVPAVCPQCARSAPAVRPQCARSVPAVRPQCARSVPAVRPQCARSAKFVPKCYFFLFSFPPYAGYINNKHRAGGSVALEFRVSNWPRNFPREIPGSPRIPRTPAVHTVDSGGGGGVHSTGGLRDISHSAIYHREFDLARNPPPPPVHGLHFFCFRGLHQNRMYPGYAFPWTRVTPNKKVHWLHLQLPGKRGHQGWNFCVTKSVRHFGAQFGRCF